MKTIVNLFFTCVLLVTVSACKQTQKAGALPEKDAWDNYFVGNIHFTDKSPESEGSKIYNRIIPNPEAYIADKAKMVLRTLYFSPSDSIVPVNDIYYSIEDKEGVSAKGGGNGSVDIWFSTRHVEKSFAHGDTAKLHHETTGVLLHELTHAYQLEPQGIGNYGNNRTFWAFIESMADAVRVENGGFTPADRPKGGNYMDGYRHGGFFLVWLKNNKDKDFLRKFNRSTLEVIPWSFDDAIKHVLGKDANIDDLWNEYQKAMGDIE